jgi:energy-coupling factor transport system ATP-binding protein
MALRPRVLILDEPTAGLDPMGREDILGEIRDYHRKTGCTILLVSHSMEDVAKCAGKLLVMNKGKVFDYGDTSSVFRRSDELEAIGLAVPQITKICNELRKRGIPLDDNIYTVKEACRQLVECYKKGGTANA